VNDGSAVDAWTFDQLLRRRSAFAPRLISIAARVDRARLCVQRAKIRFARLGFRPEDSKRAIETAQNEAVKRRQTVLCRGVPRKVWQGRPNVEEGQRGCCAFMHVAAEPRCMSKRATCRATTCRSRSESAHACGRPDIVVSEGGRLKIDTLHCTAIGAWRSAPGITQPWRITYAPPDLKSAAQEPTPLRRAGTLKQSG